MATSMTDVLLGGAADVTADALLRSAPSAKANMLELVLKVAERCNIACTYCYFFFSADQSFKDHPPIIPFDAIDDILAFVERSLREADFAALNIVLHGGEPLMAPLKTLERIIQGAKAMKDKGLVPEVTFAMQTNGLLLNDKNIAFLNKHAVGAGVSIDGDKQYHDTFRIDHKGRGTYDRAIAGYQKLAQSWEKQGGQRPGILAVANPKFDGRKIFNHFIDDVQSNNLNFLLPDVLYDDPDIDQAYVDGIEQFLIDVFRAWVDKGDPSIRIRFVDEILLVLMNDASAEISVARKLNYTKLLTISSDGTLAPEDTMKSIAPQYQSVGNVRDFTSIDEVTKQPVFQELEYAIRNPPELCRSCEWLGICVGDKPINRAAKANGLDNPSIFCTALKSLFLEIVAWMVEAGVEVKTIERRLELARQSPVFDYKAANAA